MSDVEGEPRNAIIIIETEKREVVKGHPESAQYIPCFVTDGETGYRLTSWLWGNDVNAAEVRADEYNAKAGLTPDDVAKLVLQSMRDPPQDESHHDYVNEVIETARKKLHEMVDTAWDSDNLDDYLKEDNYVLVKALFTVWGRSDPFGSFEHHRKHVKALELIV